MVSRYFTERGTDDVNVMEEELERKFIYGSFVSLV